MLVACNIIGILLWLFNVLLIFLSPKSAMELLSQYDMIISNEFFNSFCSIPLPSSHGGILRVSLELILRCGIHDVVIKKWIY